MNKDNFKIYLYWQTFKIKNDLSKFKVFINLVGNKCCPFTVIFTFNITLANTVHIRIAKVTSNMQNPMCGFYWFQ